MYERILVPYDGTAAARRGAAHAVDLASVLGSTVHALYVIEEGGNPWESEPMDDQMDRAVEYAGTVTAEVAELAEEAGVGCVADHGVGPAVYEVINDYVAENDVDAIVLGSGYKGRFGGILGGVSERVVRTADVPVTTVRMREID